MAIQIRPLPPAKGHRIRRFLSVLAALALVAATHPPKDCLPAAIAVYESLPSTVWKRVLSVRDSFGQRHAYCVFEFKGKLYAYDRMWGSRVIAPKDRTPLTVGKSIDFRVVAAYYK